MSAVRLIGLTGGIGSGKSTVAAILEELGAAIVDADQISRALTAPGGGAIGAIRAQFGADFVTVDGALDRDRMRAAAFNDPEVKRRLEAIVHPAVAAMRAGFLADRADAPLVVFDVPLLFEKGGFESVDAVLVVSAPAAAQRERVLARPGMSAEKFEQILALQVPDAQKRARADYVIDTGTSLADTRHAVQALVHRILQS